MNERLEINRGLRGKNLIEQVNRSLKSGRGVDANTYFEAITEWEDGIKFHDFDWPKRDAQMTYNRSLGGNSLLDENNKPIKAGIRRKGRNSAT